MSVTGLYLMEVQVRPARRYDQPVPARAGKSADAQLRALLSCFAPRTPTLREIRAWTPRQRAAALRWATSAYVRWGGFDILHPPAEPPEFLR